MTASAPSRLRPGDGLALGLLGLRARRLRTVLTAGGIAIGIAAMVAVVAISASSRAHLLAVLDELGTNYLTVKAGQSFFGDEAALPEHTAGVAGRLPGTQAAAGVGSTTLTVRRSDQIPALETGGMSVLAAEPSVAATLALELAHGRFLDGEDLPVVVLGATAARRLGIDELSGGPLMWLGERWFTVIGVLAEAPLAPELDTAALIGWGIAEELAGDELPPSTVYVRTGLDALEQVRDLVPRSIAPDAPETVEISRPSDAIAARAAADSALTALLVGLGAVALLVGGVGIANVMVVAVLERRTEIGLRRALGATRAHIRRQFLAEALLLSGTGGAAGVLLGFGIAGTYAASRGWPVTFPVLGLAGGVLAALAVGALAGLYPASRAARLAPADAVRPR